MVNRRGGGWEGEYCELRLDGGIHGRELGFSGHQKQVLSMFGSEDIWRVYECILFLVKDI